jgi:hypothetical protein
MNSGSLTWKRERYTIIFSPRLIDFARLPFSPCCLTFRSQSWSSSKSMRLREWFQSTSSQRQSK